MKIKNLIIEIGIRLLAILAIIYAFLVISGKYSSFAIGLTLGTIAAQYFAYTTARKQLQLENMPNQKKALKTWQYLIISTYVVLIFLTVLYQLEIVVNLGFWFAYFFSIMMIFGNYQPKIDSNELMINKYFVDADIAVKIKRVKGKITFFGGMIGLISSFFFDEIILFILFVYIILIAGVPFFYARYLQNKKNFKLIKL